jgi:hypothetical protein
MSILTMTFYVGTVVFLAVMGIEPLHRMLRAARRISVTCPRSDLPASVWARPAFFGGRRAALRVESCTRLDPRDTCDQSCLLGLR